jgi:hypothetical protein
LRRKWRRPPRISRDLLALALGYRLQEIAHGGLGKASWRKCFTYFSDELDEGMLHRLAGRLRGGDRAALSFMVGEHR